MPQTANIDSMDIDEFLNAIAQTRLVQEMLRDVVASGVGKAFGQK